MSSSPPSMPSHAPTPPSPGNENVAAWSTYEDQQQEYKCVRNCNHGQGVDTVVGAVSPRGFLADLICGVVLHEPILTFLALKGPDGTAHGGAFWAFPNEVPPFSTQDTGAVFLSAFLDVEGYVDPGP
ncbi:hypothetical protein C0992_001488, partial [Termitomyces sp. T32_za158]